MRLASFAIAALLAASAALASIPEIPDPDAGGIDARQLIGHRTCEVRKILEGRTVVLLDEGDGREHVLTLREKLRIRAQAKRDFGGRRKLSFGDLDVGHRVRVNFRRSDGEIVGIEVLKQAR